MLPHTHTTLARPAQVWTALCLVYILWGSTYLGIAVVVSGAPPLLAAGSRFALAGVIVAVVVAIRRGWRALAITRRQLAGTALIATMLLGVGNGGVSLAERYVPSSASALLIASVPLWVILLRALSHDGPSAITWAGVAFGLAGVVALVAVLGHDDPAPGDGYIDIPGWQVALWLIVILLGTLTWALGSFLSPRIVKSGWAPDNSMVMVTWQFLIAGGLLAACGLLRSEDLGALARVDAKVFIAWLLIVIAAVVAYSCYTWLLQNAPISLTSTYAYVNPLVAMFLGWLLLSEPMQPMVLGSAALIIVGVLLVVRGETRARDGQ
jgi:drug/metabolite transporter (DMT)-like permease